MAHAPATAPPWELALVPMPEAFATKSDWPAVLLVVEARSGAVRLAEPVQGPQGLKAAFTRAIKAPFEGLRPGRPRAVACPQGLLAVLQPALGALGLVCHGAHHLPAAEAAVAAMVAEMATAMMPARDIGWEGVLRSLLSPMPWDDLSPEVGWRVHGADADTNELLVTVFGPPHRPPTILLYQHEDEWRALGPCLPGPDTPLPVITVSLEPDAQLDPAVRARMPPLGVTLNGSRLAVLRLGNGEVSVPTAKAQQSLLRPCAAVLDLLTSGVEWPALGAAPAPLAGRPGLRVERLSLLPPAAPPQEPALQLAKLVEYVVFLEPRPLDDPQGEPDWIVLRTFKSSTAGLISLLKHTTAAQLRRVSASGWELTLKQGRAMDLCVGMLNLLSVPETAAQGEMRLVVAMGGARVQATAARDRLWHTTVPLTVLAEDGRPFAEAWSKLDPRGLITSASWDGPMERWPAPHRVLAAFLAPLLGPTTPREHSRVLVDAAATVWEIEALNAEGRESGYVRDILDRMVGAWLSAQLLARRRLFARDLRHIRGYTLPVGSATPTEALWEPLREGSRMP